MDLLPVSFATLHDNCFLNGKNFNSRLDPRYQEGLELFYDGDKKHLIVKWHGFVTRIPEASVKQFDLESENPKKHDRRTVQMTHAQSAPDPKAQVETPYGHVHAGPGQGKTGRK